MSVPIRRLTTSQRPVFLVNSRLGLFSATPFSFHWHLRLVVTYSGPLLFRSYEVILPSSLARVSSNTLGYSPHPPVSVSGTDSCISHLEVFPGTSSPSVHKAETLLPCHLSVQRQRGFAYVISLPASTAYSTRPLTAQQYVTPSLKQFTASAGILTSFPSLTPFGLSLGSDSPRAD